MMSFASGGRARRTPGTSRRRAVRFAPSVPETLESRRLLAAGTLGLNVEIAPYPSFVNLLQTPGNWTAVPGQSGPVTLNASGDPATDAVLLFDLRVNTPYNGPDPNAVPPPLSGTYHLSFNGQAVLSTEYQGFSTPFTVQNQTYNLGTNTTTADLVVPASNYSQFFAIEFSGTQSTSASLANTGFSNARLIRPGYAASSTQLYTNEFLAALKPYGVLRYLDDDNANNQPLLSGNTLVTVDAPQVDQTGMPWEYLVTLANQSNTDMWINIPQGATNAYVAALAGIIKNGGTVGGVSYPGLAPNLKIYLEYSNEVWGGIPNNQYYQEDAVQDAFANHPLSTFPSNLHIFDNPDGSSSPGDTNGAAGRRYLERTADIGQIFQSVLGADPTHQRIRPVLGWQENVTSFYLATLNWYQHFFGPASAAFYGMGDANYWDATDYESIDSVINTLSWGEAASAASTAQFTTIATYFGLQNVSYEGGPSIGTNSGGAAGQNALAAARDPRMEQLVYQHYVDFFAAGGSVANFYSGPFGTITPGGSYNEAELAQYANPTASAKYRGTVDIANAAPVAVTAGVPVSATAPVNFVATTDSLGEDFTRPDTGQQVYWLLNVATAGTYRLNMITNAFGGTMPGQVQVLVDNKAVNVSSVTGSSTADLGTLTLSAGIHTLSLLVIHGSFDPSQPNNAFYYQFQPTTLTLSPIVPLAIGDPGFESAQLGPFGFAYNATGSAWTFGGGPGNGSGVSGNNTGFTAANPPAPQGSHVAFVQVNGSFSQTISNWAAGNYSLSFVAAQRGSNQASAEDFAVTVDGRSLGTFRPSGASYQPFTTIQFTVTAGAHTIAFVGLDSAGGDNTALIDAVTLTSSAPAAVALGDTGFESVPVGAGSYAYNPSGSAWTFASSAGITGNNSGFTSGNPSAPQGSQVAFLQDTGSISQAVANWAAGTYTVAFQAAQRGNYQSSAEDFAVTVDGKVVGTFKPSGSAYQSYATASFSIGAGAHTLAFVGLDSTGGDNTAFIDAVTIAAASTAPTAPVAGDSGFESVAVGPGSYAYDPSGSAWSFASSAGITGNNSGFTSGNPSAPQGSQVAFLQDTGSISQSIANWAAGTYTVAFQAAQRGNIQSSAEDFAVTVDGKVVGTFKPSGSPYQSFATASFSVVAGAHTVAFVGLDSAGGDNTALIDNVTVAAAVVTPPTAPVLGDSGFEQLPIGAGVYAYDPSGSAWSFASSAGITGNNSGFTSGNPSAPQGSQVAFLQDTGSISQSIANWAAGTYTVAFQAAQRGNIQSSAEDFAVTVDGKVVGTFKPSGSPYQSFATASFSVVAGAHTVAFVGLDSAGGDNTALIDNVTIQ